MARGATRFKFSSRAASISPARSNGSGTDPDPRGVSARFPPTGGHHTFSSTTNRRDKPAARGLNASREVN